MRYLQVQFSNGETYRVPISVISTPQAKYYYDKDKKEGDLDGRDLSDYIADAEHDEDSLVDWAQNNMDWGDVKSQAVKVVEPEKIDYDDEWTNADMEVVEERVKKNTN